jgi:hypothetical protein
MGAVLPHATTSGSSKSATVELKWRNRRYGRHRDGDRPSCRFIRGRLPRIERGRRWSGRHRIERGDSWRPEIRRGRLDLPCDSAQYRSLIASLRERPASSTRGLFVSESDKPLIAGQNPSALERALHSTPRICFRTPAQGDTHALAEQANDEVLVRDS